MTRDDVIDILTVVAASDRRTVGQSDVDVWWAIIRDLSKDFALQAVREHIRDRPGVWLEPGHVYQRARALFRDQLDRAPLPEIAPRHADDEHYPGDAKAALGLPDYPRDWTPEQRVSAYWYALSMHATPRTTAGWEAIDTQLADARAKRDQR